MRTVSFQHRRFDGARARGHIRTCRRHLQHSDRSGKLGTIAGRGWLLLDFADGADNLALYMLCSASSRYVMCSPSMNAVRRGAARAYQH